MATTSMPTIKGLSQSIDSGIFRIKRPIITTNGVATAVDPTVDAQFAELSALLAKGVFGKLGDARLAADVKAIISRPLTPKFSPPKPGEAAGANGNNPDPGVIKWQPDSLAATLDDADDGGLTLSDYIDSAPALSDLKYAYEQSLAGNWLLLDTNFRFALNTYQPLRDYLVAYAVLIMQVKDFNGLKNFILNNKNGVHRVITYATVSAARDYVFNQKLQVDGYNDDDSQIVYEITTAVLSLTGAAFTPALKSLIDDFIFSGAQNAILDAATIKVPQAMRPSIIALMKRSTIPIDAWNIDFFLPLFISQLSSAPAVDDTTPTDTTVSDQDFDVEFLQDTQAIAQVSRSAVLCAAQLYYDMVLGDELDVFSAVNFFTHNYLLRGTIEIQDTTLRNDLQLYVFSNKFTDLRTNRINDRTRPAERAMFYRQVFNVGPPAPDGDTAQIIAPNTDFPKLWKVLILETAKYIQQAQAAFYPDQYVPRGNVQQSVEDLQYNLSTNCVGMVNVVSPLIYAELDFVIRRIFMHDEVMRQVVPAGGTWWRVVETLYLVMSNTRPRSTVLYNKAKLGYGILQAIANYDPASFENDDVFSNFISNVQAFITTQSILQQDQDDAGDTGGAAVPPQPAMPGMPTYVANVLRNVPIGAANPAANGAAMPPPGSAANGHANGAGDWDF
jgi:hypothetical protein